MQTYEQKPDAEKKFNGLLQLPILPTVPYNHQQPLTIKLSPTGVTLIKEGSYRSRLTGGECVVDINGKLHLSRSAYKKALQAEDQQRELHKLSLGYTQKKTRGIFRKPRAESNDKKSDVQDNTTVPKTYTVNKKEVTGRLHCMTGCLFSHLKVNAFLGMLTISFPPCVSEHNGMQALNTWLTAIRLKLGQYIWVSEFQQNGTIHYHLLILKRVNIVKVNRAMKVVLCNLVRDGVIKHNLSAMKRYNGVDLAKDRKTRQVTNFCDPKSRKALGWYITKYITKNNATFKHAAWGCSRAFSAIFTGLTCTYNEFIKMEWQYLAWADPAISTEWFDFFPWHHETGPPENFLDLLNKVNSYVLHTKGLLN